jgi:hypothetical protein
MSGPPTSAAAGNCAALKVVESLAADFVECLNRTAEIGAAADAVS